MVTDAPNAKNPLLLSNGPCIPMSGGDPLNDVAASEASVENSNVTYLELNYKGANATCKNPEGDTVDLSITINIFCNKNNQVMEDLTVTDTDYCNPVIQFSSIAGCSDTSLNALWQWIDQYKWAIFAILVVIGFFICFFGRRLFKPVIFICGVLLVLVLAWAIFYTTFLSENTDGWVGWAVLGGSIFVGLLVGFIFIKIIKLGAFILAALGGFVLALLLYNTFLYIYFNQIALYCFCFGVALVMGVLAIFLFDHIIINTTALAGAYLFVEGIGCVAGRY